VICVVNSSAGKHASTVSASRGCLISTSLCSRAPLLGPALRSTIMRWLGMCTGELGKQILKRFSCQACSLAAWAATRTRGCNAMPRTWLFCQSLPNACIFSTYSLASITPNAAMTPPHTQVPLSQAHTDHSALASCFPSLPLQIWRSPIQTMRWAAVANDAAATICVCVCARMHGCIHLGCSKVPRYYMAPEICILSCVLHGCFAQKERTLSI